MFVYVFSVRFPSGVQHKTLNLLLVKGFIFGNKQLISN